MLKVGEKYKLKKIHGLKNDDKEYTILDIVKDPNVGNLIVYDNDGETYMAMEDDFIDPENPEEYTTKFDFSKHENVFKPMNLTFWKQLTEDGACAAVAASAGTTGATSGPVGGTNGSSSLGAVPCPAMAQVTSGGISGCMVNGVPVAGKSVKKKKKKSKKNEGVNTIFNPYKQKEEDKYFASKELCVTPEEMLDNIEETFDPTNILTTYVENSRETMKILVQYDQPGHGMLHNITIQFLDIDKETIIDEVQETDLTINDCIEILQHIFKTHKAIPCPESITEDFKALYEDITDLIAKQLDRLNFQYANTEDIIYKKEGDKKYLIKFDNGEGIIKFKVMMDDDTLVEKQWVLKDPKDVEDIFNQIESIYKKQGGI